MELVLDRGACGELQAKLDSGELRLPRPTVLKKTESRLNYVDLLWQRELHKCWDFERHWSADASPQGGFNYFIILESRMQWRKGGGRPLQTTLKWRHMTATTLGYGSANELMKSLNTQHALALETGSPSLFEKARWEVLSWTSDQGHERAIVDSP
eukprot:5589288-Pyramimonas_sp.AAC.1